MHDKDATTPAAPAAGPGENAPEHVPAAAENFEHTLKRLIAERDEKRAAHAGDYR